MAEIDAAFFDALRRERFSRFSSERLSYVRRDPGRRSRLHVDVELRDHLRGFGVTLQGVAATGTRRRQLLEDFSGLPAYGFDQSKPETIRDAVARALADLHCYGIPWFSGQPVSTMATDRVRDVVDARRYDDIVDSARARFKGGDYAEAVRLFDEARAVKSLDPADEKYRAIAERKTRA